jgi:hypothetical protein
MITPIEAQRAAQAAIFREMLLLIEAKLATREILRYWHTRLTVGASEFIPGVDLGRVRLMVDDALGIDITDAIDDDPRGLLPPDQRD